MEREQIIKALECYSDKMICAIVENNRTLFVTNETVLSLIKELTDENDRLSTALAEYEHKTNIRISEEYVHNEAYEELREENKKLIEEAENYKKIAEKQQSISMESHFEIKRLTEENEKLTSIGISKDIIIESINNVIVKLNEENETLNDNNEHLAVFLAEAKADTVKKMQERLKEKAYVPKTYRVLKVVDEDDIDQIAKEMLEGNDGK